MREKVGEKKLVSWRILLGGILICLVLWGGGFIIVYGCANNIWGCLNLSADNLVRSGTFGDSFGAINALFSAFAFAGVIYTIVLQRTELGLQRQELVQTREELKGQKEEFERQNEILRFQRFENTFFQMMNLQQEIVNSLYYTCNQIEYKGRDVFKALYENTPMVYENIRQDKGDCKGLKDAISGKNRFRIEDLRAESSLNFDYSPYNEASQVSYLDHYFRHLYRIIKFVDTTNLISNTGSDNFKTRYLYTSMVRATFSRYEFVMLYYNGLSNYGVDKFKPLIEKYALLRGLRLEMLAMEEETKYYQGLSEADIKESTHLYRRSAFGVIPE